MAGEARIDSDTLVRATNALLAKYPHALVSAISSEGFGVPMPDALPLRGQRVLETRTLLDVVVSEDQAAAAKAFLSAQARGIAEVSIRLQDDLTSAVTAHVLDLQASYGVYLSILVPESLDGEHVELGDIKSSAPLAPRFATNRLTALGIILECGESTPRMFGWSPADMIGRQGLDLVHPDDQQPFIEGWMESLATGTAQQLRVRHLHSDGSWMWLDCTVRSSRDEQNQRYVQLEMVDISEEMAGQEALRAREELLNRLARALPVGLAQVELDRQITYSNERLHSILGTTPSASLCDMLNTLIPEDRPALMAAVDQVLEDGSNADVEVEVQLPETGDLRRCLMSLRALSSSTGAVAGAILCVSDITDSARMRLELEDRATYDVLTRCFNRASVMDALERALARKGAVKTAVVFVDLDHFKPVNDLLGHAAGDELLTIVAERLRGSLRGDDIIGRVGGDEFLVVCHHVSSAEEALRVAQRLGDSLTQEVALDAGTIEVRASIGVACAEDRHTTADHLVAQADVAMYQSKHQGAGMPVLFTPSLATTTVSWIDEERALHEALGCGDIVVHFQPIVVLASGKPVGFEGLIRWRRQDRLVTASEFLGLAVRTRLIHPIGEMVLDWVCREAAQHKSAGGPAGLIWSLNVSAAQLAVPGLASSMKAVLDLHDLSPSSMVVEINDHLCLRDSEIARNSVRELADTGIGVALGDFGAEWSSPDILCSLPITSVKISQRLVAEITTDRRRAKLVKSILHLGRELGVHTVVEGIESADQRDLVIGYGATLGQGDLFSPALPAQDIFSSNTV